jgi:hypothetical protein
VQCRYNETIRPMRLIDLKKSLFESMGKLDESELLTEYETAKCRYTCKSLTLFVDIINEFDYFANLIKIENDKRLQQQHQPLANEDDRLIFFKFYEPKRASLKYVFKLIVSIKSTLSMVNSLILKKLNHFFIYFIMNRKYRGNN